MPCDICAYQNGGLSPAHHGSAKWVHGFNWRSHCNSRSNFLCTVYKLFHFATCLMKGSCEAPKVASAVGVVPDWSFGPILQIRGVLVTFFHSYCLRFQPIVAAAPFNIHSHFCRNMCVGISMLESLHISRMQVYRTWPRPMVCLLMCRHAASLLGPVDWQKQDSVSAYVWVFDMNLCMHRHTSDLCQVLWTIDMSVHVWSINPRW